MHLPLQHLPPALSSLGLTCRSIHSCVYPVLYRSVIIKNEDHASQLVERISTDAALGPLIRELHVRIDLTAEPDKKRSSMNVLFELQDVTEKGFLPRLNFFGLVLLSFIIWNHRRCEVNVQFNPPSRFWASLRRCCPLLRGICIDADGLNSGGGFCGWEDFLVSDEINPTSVYLIKISLRFYRG